MKEVEPEPPAAIVTSPAELKAAVKAPGSKQWEPVVELLADLRTAHDAVVSGRKEAIPEYNFLTARLVEHLEDRDLHPWTQPVGFGDSSVKSLTGHPSCRFRTEGFELLPTDTLEFTGRYSTQPEIQPGLGAPLVSRPDKPSKRQNQLAEGKLPPSIRSRALTAIVRFEGDRATFDLVDPYSTEIVQLGGRTFPLAADYVANTSYALTKSRIDKFGLIRLLRPDQFSDTAEISRIQPYDPDRVPVLLVHGLQDTPASFAPMYYNLMADPELRRRCQFWVYSYPSGYPYPWSAALLRRELDRMKRECPGHKDIVIIGHSMGGMISRLMVTDAGDSIWRDYFGKAPADTPIRGHSREMLEEAVVFHARDDIARAIFICAPHRGAKLASNWVGQIGSRLVRLPSFLTDIKNDFIGILSVDSSGLTLDHMPNSIDTLSPNNRFVRTVAKLPIAPGIPYHSIMGDRGLGNTPDSSDGVVEYWSSHLDGAASERIVPSWHPGHQNREGIDEVRQILRQHVGLPKAKPTFIPPNPNPSASEFRQGPISKH